jgi:nucleotidyltransferase substrate binding protein (TIGR01987 family)
MEKVAQRLDLLSNALKSLADGIELFCEYEEILMNHPTQKNEKLYLSMRDSMIQRFEYSTDLFWKVIKLYLEEIEKASIAVPSPRGIVREAIKTRFLSEDEGDKCIKMVESRNKTSHMYHEAMAEEIAKKIPEYYKLLKDINDRLKLKI